MRAFFDTEYIQHRKAPTLASIAIVRDDGRELYMVSSEFCPDKTPPEGEWFFKAKVWKYMKDEPRVPNTEIAEAIKDILEGVDLLVTREGGSDRKLIESLIGPLGMEFCDINTLWESVGRPILPLRGKSHHRALDDARWHQSLYDFISNSLASQLVAA